MPDKIHPRTWEDVRAGSPVVIRDAAGVMHRRVAVTCVTRGDSFLVVWVARPEEVEAAERMLREPDAAPWPAEDVWVPGCEPESGGSDA
jgi:hypothetical protein